MSHSRKTLWRQKQWNERKANGLCVYCGNRKDGKQLACDKCRARKNEVLRKSNLNLKLQAFDAYGGRICSCKNCPERANPNVTFLTLNHIGGGGTKHRKEIGGSRNTGGGVSLAGIETYRWLRKRGYPKGFNVLCWNCQWGIHINKGVCPHEKQQ